MAKADARKLSKVGILHHVMDKINPAQIETLLILSDVDQMTDLMTGLMEVQQGQVVRLEDAFSDI
jgi:hypothetical protein